MKSILFPFNNYNYYYIEEMYLRNIKIDSNSWLMWDRPVILRPIMKNDFNNKINGVSFELI